MVVITWAGWETGLLHFSESERSYGQLRAYVLIFHHLLPSKAPSLVSNAAPTKVPRVLPHGICNHSWVADWYDGQLSTNRFHFENEEHLIIGPALIHDTRTAVQEPLCAKHLKLE
jgi:hypothetical protein